MSGPPKPTQPTAITADASVCGKSGPGCDRSILATPVRNTTNPGQPGGSTGSCGANGCPTPAPAAPPAPGSSTPLGPTNAGTGGPGGPGHAGGSGAARLNAAGSTDPNAARAVPNGPRQNPLDPNQSLNTARGPPAPSADPTNPDTAPITPGSVKPGSPNDQYSGFVGSIRRTWDSIVGTNVDNEPHNGGYIPASPGHPAQMDEGRANPVDLTEPERELLGVLPAGRGVKAVKWGVEGIQGLRTLDNEHGSTPQAPITRAPRDQPPATGASPRNTSPPTADPGPGRIINRPGTTPGTRTPTRRDTPSTAPAGRPRPGAGVRPGGSAGSRPGQRVGIPQPDRESALVGSGASPQHAAGGRSPRALTTPGTRTAPARPQAPQIEDPAPVRILPNTRPAPDTGLGGQPRLPAPAATGPRSGVGTDLGRPGVPTTPRQAGQPSGPGTDNPPVTRPGGQSDGPPTVGGGEKARGNRYQNGTLERWDAGQQRWLPIAGPGGRGTPTSAGGDPTSSSGRPRISDDEAAEAPKLLSGGGLASVAPEYFDRVSAFKGSKSEVQDFYDRDARNGVDYQRLIDSAMTKHGLTADEAHAVYGYTTKLFYRDLNEALRTGGNPSANALADLVRSGMEKMPASGPVQYRGWRLTPDRIADFDVEFAPGQVVASNFWSSSPLKDSSYNAERNAVIQTDQARNISDLAFGVHFHGLVGKPTYESETLIPPGVRFKVVENKNGQLKLREVK